MKVYKVVHADGVSLVSAILPSRFRRIYRDRIGRLRRVKWSLAFDTLKRAIEFGDWFALPWEDTEIWEAECKAAKAVAHLYYTNRLTVWRIKKFQEGIIEHGDLSNLSVPRGTLHCEDLKLIKRVK